MQRSFILSCVLFLTALPCFTQSATVITENANLRGTPDSSGKVIAVVSPDIPLTVLRQAAPWYLVQSPEYVGWIHGNTIKFGESVLQNSIRVSVPSSTPRFDRSGLLVLPTSVVPRATEDVKTNASIVEIVERATPEETKAQPIVSNIAEPKSEPTTVTSEAVTVKSETPTAVCEDGSFSYAIERQGRCSDHGGVRRNLDISTETTRTTPVSTDGPVTVKGYYRKDGTHVKSHTRKAPSRRP